MAASSVSLYRNSYTETKPSVGFYIPAGFLYLVLILITFIAGINYANNLILGFCFLMSAILCISFYLSFKQLHAITLDVIVDEVGKVNEVF